MKLSKKFIGAILISTLAIGLVGCSSANEEQQSEGIEQQQEQQSEEIDLSNLKTYEEVKKAYDQNIEKITNKEQIQELDMMNIKLDNVLEYANKAKEVASKEENPSDKIDVVDKLVTIDDLSNNTTQEVMEETLNYVISEYENGNFFNNLEVNLYLTRYLDKRLDNHPNMKNADELVFDMYQVAKDSIRLGDENLDEGMKKDLREGVEANKQQIQKKIELVKASL